MRKTMKDYRKRALKNTKKIQGGGDGTIDKDKIKRLSASRL